MRLASIRSDARRRHSRVGGSQPRHLGRKLRARLRSPVPPGHRLQALFPRERSAGGARPRRAPGLGKLAPALHRLGRPSGRAGRDPSGGPEPPHAGAGAPRCQPQSCGQGRAAHRLGPLMHDEREQAVTLLEGHPPKDRHQQPLGPPAEPAQRAQQFHDEQHHAERDRVDELGQRRADESREPQAEDVTSGPPESRREHRERSEQQIEQRRERRSEQPERDEPEQQEHSQRARHDQQQPADAWPGARGGSKLRLRRRRRGAGRGVTGPAQGSVERGRWCLAGERRARQRVGRHREKQPAVGPCLVERRRRAGQLGLQRTAARERTARGPAWARDRSPRRAADSARRVAVARRRVSRAAGSRHQSTSPNSR